MRFYGLAARLLYRNHKLTAKVYVHTVQRKDIVCQGERDFFFLPGNVDVILEGGDIRLADMLLDYWCPS